jgi:hypothetical protein
MTVETVETYANGTRPGTDVEVRRPAESSQLLHYGGPSAAVMRASLSERIAYAEQLAQAGLLPEAYRRNPANVLLAIEKGEALGIHHVVAMEGIHIIKGKSTLSAQLMRALIQRAGHQFDLVEMTRDRAVVECARRERPDRVFRHEWTIEDAREAELTTHSSSEERWRKYRKAMLAARVTSEAGNAHFSDVLAGMVWTPEDLGAVVDEAGRIVDMTPRVTSAEIAGQAVGNAVPPAGDVATPTPAPEPQVSKAQQVAFWAMDHRRTARQIEECIEKNGNDPAMAETVADPNGVATTLAKFLAARLIALDPEPATEPAPEGVAG